MPTLGTRWVHGALPPRPRHHVAFVCSLRRGLLGVCLLAVVGMLVFVLSFDPDTPTDYTSLLVVSSELQAEHGAAITAVLQPTTQMYVLAAHYQDEAAVTALAAVFAGQHFEQVGLFMHGKLDYGSNSSLDDENENENENETPAVFLGGQELTLTQLTGELTSDFVAFFTAIRSFTDNLQIFACSVGAPDKIQAAFTLLDESLHFPRGIQLATDSTGNLLGWELEFSTKPDRKSVGVLSFVSNPTALGQTFALFTAAFTETCLVGSIRWEQDILWTVPIFVFWRWEWIYANVYGLWYRMCDCPALISGSECDWYSDPVNGRMHIDVYRNEATGF